MTREEARDRNVEYFLASADESFASARSELGCGRTRFAVNRLYYACFYAVSAVLLNEGRHFVKHAGVRAALHEHLVKTGRIPTVWGDFYDELLKDRQVGDYGMFAEFDLTDVRNRAQKAEQFFDLMRTLLGKSGHGNQATFGNG
jgi:uncharacterized protein